MKNRLLLLLVLLSAPTFAAQEEINSQVLQACSVIENDFNRLLCYDNTIASKSLTKPLVNTNTAPEPSVKKILTPPTVKATTNVAKVPDNFGIEHKEIAKEKEKMAEIKATVTSVKKTPCGELILTLDNHQQWRQKGSGNIRIREKDTIVIKRGVLNSFLLSKVGQNRVIRVTRTK